jgi:hypothetical protein
MKRGFGLGEKFAREKFELCWREFATGDEIKHLDHVHGGAWCANYPPDDWKEYINFKPQSEDYIEFAVVIYPNELPHRLARFLVPREQKKANCFLIWHHYQGSKVFQEV